MEEHIKFEFSGIFQVKLVAKNIALGSWGPILCIWVLKRITKCFLEFDTNKDQTNVIIKGTITGSLLISEEERILSRIMKDNEEVV